MAELSDIQQTIAKQINYKELAFAKFKFSKLDLNEIIVYKGNKYLSISYNYGSDLYDLKFTQTRKFEIVKEEEIKGVFCDQLQEIIQDKFKFEYLNLLKWECA